MVASPLFPLVFLLLLATVVYCADQALAPSTDESPPLPAFDSTKCVRDTSVFCLVPVACDDGEEFKILKHPDPYNKKCGIQVMIRTYNPKKMLVEIWASGESVLLKDKLQKTIFGCKASEGGVVPITDRPNTELKEQSVLVKEESFYCRFSIESTKTEILPAPKGAEEEQKLKLVNQKAKDSQPVTYTRSRGELRGVASGKCDYDWITTEKFVADEGYIMEAIPYENLFAQPITCPANSVLMYESNKKKLNASGISCGIDEAYNKYQFKIDNSPGNGGPTSVTKEEKFRAGCQKKICAMCSEPKFNCSTTGCDKPQPKSIDDCTVYQCPKSVVAVNGKPGKSGDITCAKISDKVYDWTFGNKQVETAECPKEIPCHVANPLKCVDDPNCAKLSDVSSSVVNCKDSVQMKYVIDGTDVEVNSLVCNLVSGVYKTQTKDNGEPDLPKGAEIKCADASKLPAPTTDPQAKTGAIPLYAVIGGGAGLLALIVVIITVVCCCRKARKRKEAAKLPPTATTTKTNERTTKTKSSLESKTTTPPPVRSVPIAAPTPIARTATDTAATPWDVNLTERTPNAPTPLLVEQPTQVVQTTQRRTKSDTRSLPPAPTPKEETAQPADQEQSKSGVESTKRTGVESDPEPESKKSAGEAPIPAPPQKRRTNQYRSINPTQGETQESTKKTQNESRTRTQRTQDMRTEEAAAPIPTIPTRMPPKKNQYIAMGEAERDSFDSDKSNHPVDNKPIKPLASTPANEKQNPYLMLGDFMGPADGVDKDKNLVTQQSEDDVSIKKSKSK